MAAKQSKVPRNRTDHPPSLKGTRTALGTCSLFWVYYLAIRRVVWEGNVFVLVVFLFGREML